MGIGTKIKEARTNKRLTQEQVAETLLVSRQTVSNWENGKSLPDIVSVIKMSELYEISLDALLKGDTTMIKKLENDVKAMNTEKRIIAILLFFYGIRVHMRGYGIIWLRLILSTCRI